MRKFRITLNEEQLTALITIHGYLVNKFQQNEDFEIIAEGLLGKNACQNLSVLNVFMCQAAEMGIKNKRIDLDGLSVVNEALKLKIFLKEKGQIFPLLEEIK
jgi:hypothetical protein